MRAQDIPVLWDFDPFSIPTGEIRRIHWAFERTMDGGAATIPLTVIAGTRSGKTVVLIAGIHGDEYEGPYALWELGKSLDPSEVYGRLLIVPVAHGAAFNMGLRVSPIDGIDLARVFPGDASGTITYRLAHHLFTNVVNKADILVDCHSGGVRTVFAPVAGFYANNGDISVANAEKSLCAARAMGLPFLWSLPHREGVLSYEAAKIGIAATGVEIGGRGGQIHSDSVLYRHSIRRLLHAWDILEGESAPELEYKTYLEGDWQTAPVAGLIQNHVELEQRVTAGEDIVSIYDTHGEQLVCLKAYAAGIVMGLRHLCSVQVGDWVTCAVKEKSF